VFLFLCIIVSTVGSCVVALTVIYMSHVFIGNTDAKLEDGVDIWYSEDGKPRPFACTTCDKRFTCRANLIIHSRTHSGVKPYECSICNKRFVTEGRLLRHQKAHTQARMLQFHE